MAGRRDASWYANPGRAEVSHVAVEVGAHEAPVYVPACNATLRHGVNAGHKGVMLVEETLVDAATIHVNGRCQRPGCKQRWPK